MGKIAKYLNQLTIGNVFDSSVYVSANRYQNQRKMSSYSGTTFTFLFKRFNGNGVAKRHYPLLRRVHPSILCVNTKRRHAL